jgi:hypothetical protein
VNLDNEVAVHLGHFRSKRDVLRELDLFDLWPVTAFHDDLPPGPLHSHPEGIRIYIMSGTLLVSQLPVGKVIAAPPGTRVDIPAGAVHALSASDSIVTITAVETPRASGGLQREIFSPSNDAVLAEKSAVV